MLYKLSEFKKFISEQDEITQHRIKKEFEFHLKPNPEVYRFYVRKGLSSPFVIAEFIVFLETYFRDVIGTYLNFEDYLTSEQVSW